MKLAMLRLRNLGWLALVFLVAISLYPLSLSVASTRNNLTETEAAIARTKTRIRYLETEFATRANLQQLQMWNDVNFGFVAPDAAQYLKGERALANLGKDRREFDGPVQVAVMTTPFDVEPAGLIGSPFGDLSLRPADANTAEVENSDLSSPTATEAEDDPRRGKAASLRRVAEQGDKGDKNRRERFAAKMEIQLLTDRPVVNREAP